MQWEEKFLLWIQKNIRKPYLTPYFKLVSFLCDRGVIWICIAFCLIVYPQTRQAGLKCLLTMVLGFITVNLFFKNSVARIRPFQAMQHLRILIAPPQDYSFPSGHTTVSFAATAAIFFAGYNRLALPLFVYALQVAFSRMYLGVHYPTDVLAGAFIGTAVAYGVRLAL